MTSDMEALIREAAEKLRIIDIVLYEARFERPNRATDKMATEGKLEHKRQVQYYAGPVPSDPGAKRSLQVLVSLGVRIVAHAASEPDKPFFFVEADYLVNYELSGSLDEPHIKAFADNNSVHNVWPFWHQHVFDVIHRARLPHVEIPLYSGVKQ